MNALSSTTDAATPKWRTTRRVLLTLGILATLIAVFYTVENWRGKRAWDKCRSELERQGEVLDWKAFIPPPVPDDENFFKAPRMQEWFVKDSSLPPGTTKTKPPPFMVDTPRKAVVVAQIKIVAPGETTDSSNVVLRFEDPASPEKAAELLTETIGPCAFGAINCVLLRKPLDQVAPLPLILQAERAPTGKDLARFFPRTPLTNASVAWSAASFFRVEAQSTNAFQLVLAEPVYDATQYLALSEPASANFDLVRKALERPYARMEGNYEQPYAAPLANFVEFRTVAQILSQRAQSHLLLGHSQAAWQELALIRDLCGILGSKPPGKPVTLVAAMIEVAVTGLYAAKIEDGLRLHAWAEPELAAIERQLKETHLLESLVKALHAERAGTSRTIEITSSGELARMFRSGFPEKFQDLMVSLRMRCMPRGWFYQNMAIGAALEQQWLGCVDPANHLVIPDKADAMLQKVDEKFRSSPYSFLTAAAIPNFIKAVQTTARNQTSVNQARIACALERCRLAQGQYPESLDQLVPRYIDKLPHDLIGGQPLKYQRTDDGTYLLYSVGWDDKDEGGSVSQAKECGDWVWARVQ